MGLHHHGSGTQLCRGLQAWSLYEDSSSNHVLGWVVHFSWFAYPHLLFYSIGQVVSTIIAGTVQLGVQAWMFGNIPDMCSPKQKHGLICPSTEVFGTASIIWGVIGPQRVFSSGQVYYGEFSSPVISPVACQ